MVSYRVIYLEKYSLALCFKKTHGPINRLMDVTTQTQRRPLILTIHVWDISCINEDFKKKLLVAYIFLLVIAAKITGPSGKETEGSDQQNVRRSYYH